MTKINRHSYLLRLWETDPEGAPLWRASLEDITSREILYFADIAAVYHHLLAVTAEGPRIRSDQPGERNEDDPPNF